MAFQGSKPLVLEYKKRRFDGGCEREMIEQIEYQHRMRDQQRLESSLKQHVQSSHHSSATPSATEQAIAQYIAQTPQAEAPTQVPSEKPSLVSNLYKAFVVPYVELILGLSGILIGYLMIYSLFKGSLLSAEIMKQERNALVHHSWVVIRNSVKQIILSPFVAVKLCLA